MKRTLNSLTRLAAYQDPLKKREEFAVSLRKKKTHEIINAKRRRLIATATQDEGPEHVKSSYQGYKRFEAATEEYLTKMQELCPRFLHDQSLTPVRQTD